MRRLPFDAWPVCSRIRERQPVVHHLTNWVTIADCANVVKALGGSPVMAHAPEEVADMTAIAAALVLNIGTLTVPMVESMLLAARAANDRGIPVVLDAVGVGATRLRDVKCQEILDTVKIDVVKGNASEIARLSGLAVRTRGVDAAPVDQDLRQVALALARQRGCVVVITGAADIVAAPERLYVVANGHPRMGEVVGTGCMAASVIGACAAVEPDLAYAAAAGLACFGVAAQIAGAANLGPMAFKTRLLDELYFLQEDRLAALTWVEA